MMRRKDKVFIIILNWNNEPDTSECLESALQIVYSNYKIVLIDNGSTDNSFELIMKKYAANGKISLLRNNKNLGYTGGNNLGIKYALDNGADYVLVLNNDTVVDKNLIDELSKPFKMQENLAVTTPKIYFYSKRDVLWSAGGEFDSKELIVTMNGFNQYDSDKYNYEQDCTFTTGAAMFIKASVLEKVGAFDEALFHSGEDLDLSLRITQSGYGMKYVPSAVLWHKVMASSGKGEEMSPLGAYYEYRNKLIVLSRYGHLKSFRSKIIITRRYCKAFLSFLIKKKRLKIAEAMCFSIIDFICGRHGKLSYIYMEKRWRKN